MNREKYSLNKPYFVFIVPREAAKKNPTRRHHELLVTHCYRTSRTMGISEGYKTVQAQDGNCSKERDKNKKLKVMFASERKQSGLLNIRPSISATNVGSTTAVTLMSVMARSKKIVF